MGAIGDRSILKEESAGIIFLVELVSGTREASGLFGGKNRRGFRNHWRGGGQEKPL